MEAVMGWLERTVLPGLLGEVGGRYASILVGPRQVGKTVILKMLQARLRQKTAYLDVENPDGAEVFRNGLRSLLAEIGTEPQVLFLDEFHRLPDPLALFKQIRDAHPHIKVYASGSSSLEIHSRLKQSAVGRVRRTRVFPLSFSEWCPARTDVDLASWDPRRPLPPRKALRVAAALEDFIVWGGMPELTQAENEAEKRTILREIVSLYLERDVRSLLRSDEVLRFGDFLRLIAMNVGQYMNRSRFGMELGLNSRQMERQLQVMEHTFVYRPVTADYANPTKRLLKAPKIFWYDNGIRNALVRDFRKRPERPDGGALLENHVHAELEKSGGPDVAVLTHRTLDGQEVDFVLEKDRRKVLVEVKSGLARPSIPHAIRDLLAREDVLSAVVLNERLHEEAILHGKPVLFLPSCLAHRVPTLLP
jgi:predicted AAA+ superfamily ATPase